MWTYLGREWQGTAIDGEAVEVWLDDEGARRVWAETKTKGIREKRGIRPSGAKVGDVFEIVTNGPRCYAGDGSFGPKWIGTMPDGDGKAIAIANDAHARIMERRKKLVAEERAIDAFDDALAPLVRAYNAKRTATDRAAFLALVIDRFTRGAL